MDSNDFYEFPALNDDFTTPCDYSTTCQSSRIFAENTGREQDANLPCYYVQNSAINSMKMLRFPPLIYNNVAVQFDEAKCRNPPRYYVQNFGNLREETRKSDESANYFINSGDCKNPASYTQPCQMRRNVQKCCCKFIRLVSKFT